MVEVVADVYLIGPSAGRSSSYRTLPGQTLNFQAGAARVVDEREMVWVLRRPDMEVAVRPTYLDFIADWMNRCGDCDPPQARVSLPPGLQVTGTPGNYVLGAAPPPPDPEAAPEPIGWAVTEAAVCPICEETFARAEELPWLAPQKYCGADCRKEAEYQRNKARYAEKKAKRLQAQEA